MNAQTTIFSENMGSVSSTTAILGYSGWQNNSTLTFGSGSAANPADIRSSNISSGYANASGGANIFFTATTERGFSIEGINASTFSNIQLSFAYRKESATAFAGLSVDYWNGSTWVTIANSPGNLFNETASSGANWYLAKKINSTIWSSSQWLENSFCKISWSITSN